MSTSPPPPPGSSPDPAGAEPPDETKGQNPWILPGLAITVLIVAVVLVLIFNYGQSHHSPTVGEVPSGDTSQHDSVVDHPVP